MKAVASRRQRLKIAGYRLGIMGRAAWTDTERKLLGTRPDDELARDLGPSYLSVRHQRERMEIPCFRPGRKPWAKWELGTERDEYVARATGRSLLAVVQMRRQRAILRRTTQPWTEAERLLLGTDSDRNVGKRLGRSRKAVAHMRERLHITACKRS